MEEFLDWGEENYERRTLKMKPESFYFSDKKISGTHFFPVENLPKKRHLKKGTTRTIPIPF